MPPNNTNTEKINNNITQMENLIKYLIKIEFKINDHLTFTQHLKENLSLYRKNLTSLANYLSQNELKKIQNFNCNTITDVTPISIKQK